MKLSWTVDVVPYAVFWTSDHSEFVERLAERFPSVEELDRSAIARTHPELQIDFTRKPTLDAYASRASIERRDNGYLLASSWSDLIERRDGTELGYGAFDPPAPRGETLYSRARRCRELIEDVRAADRHVARFESGSANGLGFDCRRLSSGVQTDHPAARSTLTRPSNCSSFLGFDCSRSEAMVSNSGSGAGIHHQHARAPSHG
ncbi:MAG: hypothetical protein U5R31_03225 [Acidimicrobiia bacterium]|nr:hypothetical protein [Acidimicrobiia bacterium]